CRATSSLTCAKASTDESVIWGLLRKSSYTWRCLLARLTPSSVIDHDVTFNERNAGARVIESRASSSISPPIIERYASECICSSDFNMPGGAGVSQSRTKYSECSDMS